MFELSVALHYLLPKKRQLSAAIISLVSMGVIALVVWLILVFFSVTKGLERSWIDKLVALAGPMRITPTSDYYASYYYQIDALDPEKEYALRSLGEKLEVPTRYFTAGVPQEFPHPDLTAEGLLKDPVALLYEVAQEKGVILREYVLAPAVLRLEVRANASQLSQPIILASQEEAPISVLEGKIEPTGLLAPKSFRDAGVRVGDRGVISYQALTPSRIQEQRIATYISGFYDPGLMGGRFFLANGKIVRALRSAQQQEETLQTNGFQLESVDIAEVEPMKKVLQQALFDRDIAAYWHIESFRDYDHAKDLLQQLSSERHLFTAISMIILLVACSNIVSMLILLVNDKRHEIGILRAMGASSGSIAIIFGLCGMVMGILGAFLGTFFAFFTLHHLDALLGWIAHLQGYEAFNPLFYGNSLPKAMHYPTLWGVLLITTFLSLIAGMVPAWKSSRIAPAHILRS